MHDEKKHDVLQVRLLKMLLMLLLQTRLKIPLQVTQLYQLNNFLLMKTLVLQLNKLVNLPQSLLNKYSINKSN